MKLRNDEGHSIFRVGSPVCLYATVESAIEYAVYSLVEQPGLELPDQFASPMNRDWDKTSKAQRLSLPKLTLTCGYTGEENSLTRWLGKPMSVVV